MPLPIWGFIMRDGRFWMLFLSSEAMGLLIQTLLNLKYYIGYVEFLEMKKEALEAWGDDFSQKKFHKAVLDIGPAPFDLVREYALKK